MLFICITLVAIFGLAFWQYVKYKFEKQELDNSISLPPPHPTVTPTIVAHDIVIGPATYCDITMPELMVNVISVDYDGTVFFTSTNTGYANTLPRSEFLLRYERREQTKISKL